MPDLPDPEPPEPDPLFSESSEPDPLDPDPPEPEPDPLFSESSEPDPLDPDPPEPEPDPLLSERVVVGAAVVIGGLPPVTPELVVVVGLVVVLALVAGAPEVVGGPEVVEGAAPEVVEVVVEGVPGMDASVTARRGAGPVAVTGEAATSPVERVPALAPASAAVVLDAVVEGSTPTDEVVGEIGAGPCSTAGSATAGSVSSSRTMLTPCHATAMATAVPPIQSITSRRRLGRMPISCPASAPLRPNATLRSG